MNLIEQLYKTYKAEPLKHPQIIPSSGECIGYDIEYPFDEVKFYKVVSFLTEHRVDITLADYGVDLTYSYDVEEYTVTGYEDNHINSLAAALIKLYDKIPEGLQLDIRNVLSED